MVNTQGLNTPNQFAILFRNSMFQQLIDVSAFSSQQIALNGLTDCLGASRTSFGSIIDFVIKTSNSKAQSCVNTYNNQLNSVLVDKTSTYENQVNIDGSDFTSNSLRVDLKTATVFPTFIITLDAEKVGIRELKGKPKIISCVEDREVLSGDTYNTNVEVQNIGSNAGSFIGSVSCSGDSGVTGFSSEQLVEAGETITIPVSVSGINSESGEQKNTCIVTIEDRKSGDSDSCRFDFDITFQEDIICSPGKVTCSDLETLRTCSEDGLSFEENSCQFGCTILESGESLCVEEEDKSKSKLDKCESCDAFVFGEIIKKNQCEPTFGQKAKSLFGLFGVTCALSFLKFGVTALIFILLLVFGTLGLKKVDGIKQSKASGLISFLISLVVAVLLAFLIFNLFIIGIIVAIVILVVLRMFKGGRS